MEWMAGSFYRINNREEKNRKYLTGWGHRVWVKCLETMAWCLEIDYMDILCFWSIQVFLGMQKLSKFQFANVASRQEWLHLSRTYMKNLMFPMFL